MFYRSHTKRFNIHPLQKCPMIKVFRLFVISLSYVSINLKLQLEEKDPMNSSLNQPWWPIPKNLIHLNNLDQYTRSTHHWWIQWTFASTQNDNFQLQNSFQKYVRPPLSYSTLSIRLNQNPLYGSSCSPLFCFSSFFLISFCQQQQQQ